ncbi:MAG: cytochrome b N-terminal domain-containing protein [Pyrinomonadaceae bacterium]
MSEAERTTSSSGAWLRANSWLATLGGMAAMLLVVQFATGTLLAFYYVPSVDHAHTTVAFIEKGLSSGSWIRSVHNHSSQLLPAVLFLHLLNLFRLGRYENAPRKWVTAVLLLLLVMAAAATGYSLPWDARAFFSTRIADGLVGGLPFVGRFARLWLLGTNEISTLTLSRFFALHVLITPFLFLVIGGWRLYIFARRTEAADFVRAFPHQFIAAGVVFLLLAFWSIRFPAPLGPAAAVAGSDYLPRPGNQFLWLYQILKYVPGSFGSLVGIIVPSVVILVLLFLPWLQFRWLRRLSNHPRTLVGGTILIVSLVAIIFMTGAAYLADRIDPRARDQLARQAAEDENFRRTPLTPELIVSGQTPAVTSGSGAPDAYVKFCAMCHGQSGEGARQGVLHFPPLIGVGAKPHRTVDDIVRILNDPTAYGLEPPMRSFATKLSDAEKREIAEWVVKLK